MDRITIGKQVEFSKSFTKQNILDFSQVSEDNNPIHVDKNYATNSIFGNQVVHGVLLVGMFSKIFGTLYPGNGSIYLGQTSKFIKPAFIDELILARVTLISFDYDKNQGIFLTECFKDSDVLILTGEAKILFPR
jgi:3-hydroxybutyryl-CoA dehydratase